MGKTRLAPLGWKKGPFLQVRPAGKKRKPKKHRPAATVPKARRRKFAKGGYAQYLASEHWQRMRQRYLTGAKCCACKHKGSLVLHHVHYKRLWQEATGDLIVLCHSCHERLHATLNRELPRYTTAEKAKRTAFYFEQALGTPWKASYAFTIAHRASKPKGTEQHADRPPDTTGHKCCSPKGGSSDLGECVHSLAPSEDLACLPLSDK